MALQVSLLPVQTQLTGISFSIVDLFDYLECLFLKRTNLSLMYNKISRLEACKQ
jgi:hypothetical protein